MVRIFSRSKRYLDEIKTSMRIADRKDQHKIDSLYAARQRLRKQKGRMTLLRVIFFAALYASILSGFTSIFNLLPLLSKFLDFVLTYLGIIGTTFSIIMILILNHSIRNYERDIATLESHILAIHVKYDNSPTRQFDDVLKKLK